GRGKAPETEGQQPVPHGRDDIRTGEEGVQTRALERLPLGLAHQGAQALPALDPRGVLRPMGAQTEGGLEGGVAEAAEARQDRLLLAGWGAPLGLEILEQGKGSQIGIEARGGASDEVSRSADVIGAVL